MSDQASRPFDERSRLDTREHELLVVRCQLGEPAAFDELIARWHAPLWRFLRRMTNDDDSAAEIVQDTWLRVLRAIGRLQDGARLQPWLFAIARRALMDRLRQKYAAPRLAPIEEADITAEPDARDLEAESRLLHEELDALPVVEREVLALFYLQELSLTELAQVLDVPVGTVKSRLFRARRLLRERLVAKGMSS
jgi:RNA polymerase sigma-70 factor (ECF subfamily)